MRSRANENPLVQAALIGILVLVFGFIFVTRIMGGGGSEASGDDTPAAEQAAAATGTAPPTDAAATGSAPTAPTEASATAPATPESGAVPSEGTGSLEAGEGMPADVVDAYEAGKVVVLLVVDSDAIDDKRVEEASKDLEGRSDVALFQTEVKNVADYSQITNGVALNRTPALIVLSPRDVSGDVPVASVSYGFRSLQSVNQAVEDAKYDGKKAPYYPE